MGNKNMIDLIVWHFKASQLLLSTLATVNKKVPLKYIEYLSGSISLKRGDGWTAPQYSQFEFHKLIVLFFLFFSFHLVFQSSQLGDVT